MGSAGSLSSCLEQREQIAFLLQGDEAAGRLQGEQAVEIVGQDGHGEVEIDLDDHGGGEPAEMEEGQLLGN